MRETTTRCRPRPVRRGSAVVAPFDFSSWLHWAYAALALVASLGCGLFCFEIHGIAVPPRTSATYAHQAWFNFLGALVGWVAAWPVLSNVVACAQGGCAPVVSWSMAGLAALAFVGVTGYLPYAVMT